MMPVEASILRIAVVAGVGERRRCRARPPPARWGWRGRPPSRPRRHRRSPPLPCRERGRGSSAARATSRDRPRSRRVPAIRPTTWATVGLPGRGHAPLASGLAQDAQATVPSPTAAPSRARVDASGDLHRGGTGTPATARGQPATATDLNFPYGLAFAQAATCWSRSARPPVRRISAGATASSPRRRRDRVPRSRARERRTSPVTAGPRRGRPLQPHRAGGGRARQRLRRRHRQPRDRRIDASTGIIDTISGRGTGGDACGGRQARKPRRALDRRRGRAERPLRRRFPGSSRAPDRPRPRHRRRQPAPDRRRGRGLLRHRHVAGRSARRLYATAQDSGRRPADRSRGRARSER